MDRHLAIRKTHENVGFIDGESDAWDLDGNKISIDEELVTKEMAKIQAEYDAQEYARNRSSEYPTWQEQMDMQYHDAKNGTNTWQQAIEAVKTKYPKGE